MKQIRRGDLPLVGRQIYFEQLSFWRNRVGAIFTVGFSVVFLVLLSASNQKTTSSAIPGVLLPTYYVAGFAAYGVMSACFNNLSIQLVIRRETGLLKRLRLSPLPTWVFLAGIYCSEALVVAIQVFLLLVIGHFGYHVMLPDSWGALIVALASGVFCFTAIGTAIASVLPNQESAGPVVSLAFFVLLFLAGLWFPLNSGSALARASDYLPIRRMIIATLGPFDRDVSPWAWHDIGVLLAWGVVATVFALRHFRFEPRRH